MTDASNIQLHFLDHSSDDRAMVQTVAGEPIKRRTEEVKCICQRMLIYSTLLKPHAAKESYSPTKRFLIELIVVFNIKEKATLFKNVKFAHNPNF